MNDIKRGEMFYISRGGASYNGSEQHSDRPAVVVSNNKNNENSNVVEIVYMTTQPKTDLPTHVTIRSTGRISTVLCEQVYSVSTERNGACRNIHRRVYRQGNGEHRHCSHDFLAA